MCVCVWVYACVRVCVCVCVWVCVCVFGGLFGQITVHLLNDISVD